MKLQELIVEAKGEYNSFKSWKAAIKKKHPDAWFDGDADIASAMVGPKPFKRGETKSVGEWDGDKGELFEGLITEGREMIDDKWYAYSKRNDTLEGPFDDMDEAKKFWRKMWKEFDNDASDTVIASGADMKKLKVVK